MSQRVKECKSPAMATCNYCQMEMQAASAERHFNICIKRRWVREQTRALLVELVQEHKYVTQRMYSQERSKRGITGYASARAIIAECNDTWNDVPRVFDLPVDFDDLPTHARFEQPIGPLPAAFRASNRNDIPTRDFGAILTTEPVRKRVYDWAARGWIVETLCEVR